MDPAACESDKWPFRTWVSIFILGCSSSSTSALRVLFMLSNSHLYPHPSLMSNFSPLRAARTLFYSLFHSSISNQDLNYTPETDAFLSFFPYPLPSLWPLLFCFGGSESRTRHPTVHQGHTLNRRWDRWAEESRSSLNLSWQVKVPNDWPWLKITATSPAAAAHAGFHQAGLDFLPDLPTETWGFSLSLWSPTHLHKTQP